VQNRNRQFAPEMRATFAWYPHSNDLNPGTSLRADLFFDVPRGTQVTDCMLVFADGAGPLLGIPLK